MLSSLLSVILNICFGSLVGFYVLLFTHFLEHLFAPIMGRFDEPNMGLPILGTVLRELLLLGYIILQMPQRKKWDPERMKAAIKAIRNREMGSYKASRFFNVSQTTLECYVKDQQESSSKTVKNKTG